MSFRRGDWNCPKCRHSNFARRHMCEKCTQFRPDISDPLARPLAKAGDWTCPACSEVNFARRQICCRCKRDRPVVDSKPLSGDWSCQACKASNYASRAICFKCREPKPGEDILESRKPDKDLCVICQVNTRNYMVDPCGHFAFCIDCKTTLTPGSLCPVCRSVVAGTKRVIVS